MSEQRMRASDAERERVAAVVRAAMADGRLPLTEGEDRLAAVYAAAYRDELTGLTADLPGAEPEDPKPAGTPTGHPFGWGDPRVRPAAFGLFGLALLATGWALWLGGPTWPVITLFIVAAVVTKHRLLHRRAEFRGWKQCGPWRRDPDASSPAGRASA